MGNTASASSFSDSRQSTSTSASLPNPELASSGDEDQEQSKNLTPTPTVSRKRRRNQEPQWLEGFFDKVESAQQQRHEELKDMMKRQEDAIKECPTVMKEMKDIFKSWVDKQ